MVNSEQNAAVMPRRHSADEWPTAIDTKPETRADTVENHTFGSLATHLIERYRFLLLVLWVLAAITVGRIALRSMVPLEPTAVAVGVDPNAAPWWELTALPGVGKVTAQNILSFRDSIQHAEQTLATGEEHGFASAQKEPSNLDVPPSRGPPVAAFRNPMDLTRVRGIGPRTVQRMAPHLRFETAEQLTTANDSVK